VKGFADLADMPEDDRIAIIVRTVLQGKTVGVALEREPEKIARYKAKLRAAGVVILDERPSEIAGVVFLRVGPQ
jgi:SH3-like domain-containing protein